MQLTYGMYETMGLEGTLGNAVGSNAPVVRTFVKLSARMHIYGRVMNRTKKMVVRRDMQQLLDEPQRVPRIARKAPPKSQAHNLPFKYHTCVHFTFREVGLVDTAMALENIVNKPPANLIATTNKTAVGLF